MSAVDNWFEEKQSAWLYRIVTRAEPDPVKSTLFAELADVAESQARIWQKQIERQGAAVPAFHPSLRARVVARLIRLAGPRGGRPGRGAGGGRGGAGGRGGRGRGGRAGPAAGGI